MTFHFSHTSEKALLERVAAGDDQAFATLYDNYSTGLISFVSTILKSTALAEDTAQETFIKIWEKRSELREIRSFQSYLYVVARNRALDLLRKAATESAARRYIISSMPETRNDAKDKLELEGYWAYITRVLDSLPPQTREVFILCRGEQKTHEEIAALLGISPNAVKRHMMRSNRAFKNSLDQELCVLLALTYLLAEYLSQKN